MSDNKGLITSGFILVRRHQRILWWIVVVSLALSWLGSLAPATAFGKALDHSMLGQSDIVKEFRILTAGDLFSRQDIPMNAFITGAVGLQIIFFVFMLFISPGILTAYREDRHLTTAEFFEASGLYFWRFVRLLLMMIVPLIFIMLINTGFGALIDKLNDATPRQDLVVYSRLAAMFVVILLALLVRLWFDVAQVRAVSQNESSMWRNTWRAFTICRHALGTLLWMYFRISLVAWLVLGLGIWIWSYIPSSMYSVSWLLLEIVTIVQIGVRLWLRASSVAWYERYADLNPVMTTDYTTPRPMEIVAPAGEQIVEQQ